MRRKILFSILLSAAMICIFSLVGCSLLNSSDNKSNTSDVNSFTYELNSDGRSYAITGILDSTIENIVLPEEYDGLPITSIRANVFEGMDIASVETVVLSKNLNDMEAGNFCNNGSITTVSFSTGLTRVPDECFNNLGGLTHIFWGEHITEIGDKTFQYCTTLTHFTFPDSITEIGTDAFSYSAIEEIEIPSTVKVIKPYSFYHLENLKTVIIQDGITELDHIFEMCENVETLVIPNSVVVFDDSFSHAGNKGSLKNLKNLTAPIGLFDESALSEHGVSYLNCGDKLVSLTLNAQGENTKIMTTFPCSMLESLVIGEGITEIGEDVFSGAIKLKEINLPSSVEIIGAGAFSAGYSTELGGSAVRVVNLGGNVKTIGDAAFYEQGGLISVTGGERVEIIGNSAFAHCERLTDYDFGEAVKTIGNGAFQDCKSLTAFNIGSSVESIGKEAFRGSGLYEIVIPDNVTYIGEYAFSNIPVCSKLVLGTGIKTILPYTFAQSEGLFELAIPEGVEVIREKAFENCRRLGTVTFSSTVKNVDNQAFVDCDRVREIVINGADIALAYNSYSQKYKGYGFDKVERIFNTVSEKEQGTAFVREDAFMFYEHLNGEYTLHSYYGTAERLALPEDINNSPYTIEDYTFYNDLFLKEIVISGNIIAIGTEEGNVFAECPELEKVTITSSITAISKNMFYLCDKLCKVELPSSVITIDENAFSHCSSLKYIRLPKALESVKSYAFNYSGLKCVVFSDSIKAVELYAFAKCEALEYVCFEGTAEVFGNVNISERNNELVEAEVYYYSQSKPLGDGNYYCYNASGLPVNWATNELMSI